LVPRRRWLFAKYTAARDRSPPYADETMKLTSESLSPSEGTLWMGSQGILRRSDAGWGVIRGKRVVPNESELDSAKCRGRAGGETASAGGNSGRCWRSLGPRPDRQTAQTVSRAGLSALQGCLEWERSKVSWVKSGSLPPQAERATVDRAPIGAMKRVMIVEQRGVGR
jgi:hypothetical protein